VGGGLRSVVAGRPLPGSGAGASESVVAMVRPLGDPDQEQDRGGGVAGVVRPAVRHLGRFESRFHSVWFTR
jgi:hypothetical protein